MRFQRSKVFVKLFVLTAITCLAFVIAPSLSTTQVNAQIGPSPPPTGGTGGTNNNISVSVDITMSSDGKVGTYGPVTIRLKSLDHAINEPSLIDSQDTDTIDTTSSNTQAVPISLSAMFEKVDQGAYEACIQGTNLCSTRIQTASNADYSATIAVPTDKSDQFFTPAPDEAKSCENTASLGFIVCPLVKGLAKLNDFMWNFVKSLLKINPLRQSNGSSNVGGSIYTAWSSIRGIANVLFVVFFLIIIFSQLTGAGVSNYGIKKLLPRIIVAAILVNVSFLIVQISVDLANIIGSGLYDLITGLAPPFEAKWEVLALGGVEIGGIAVAAGLAGGMGVLFWMLLPVALMGSLGFLAAMLTLIFRQAAIPILAILAPLAFVAYLLPNTQSWFKKWLKLLMTMMMMYPLAALVFAGAQFAAAVIMGSRGAGFMEVMIGQIMMVLPLFSLPFIAKQGGPMLTKVGGSLNKLAEKARKPIGDWAKTHEDLRRAEYTAGAPRAGARGILQRRYKNAMGRRQSRLKNTASANEEFTSEWGGSVDRRMGNGQAAIGRAQLAKTTTAADSEEDTTRFSRSAVGQAAIDRLNEAKLETQVDTHQAATRTEIDPALLELRLGAAAAKKESEATAAQTAQVVVEQSTQAAPPIPGVAPAIRATLQDAQRAAELAASATNSAQRIQKEEYERAIAPPVPPGSPPGTPVPLTGAATAAAGIDTLGGRGITRVQAIAREATDKRESEEVAARAVLIASSTDTAHLAETAGDVLTASLATDDAIGVRAAIQHLIATGGVGKKRLGALVSAIPDGDTSDAALAARSAALSGGIKTSDVSISKWATDGASRDLATIRSLPGTYDGLTPEELATQSPESLSRGMICGGITPEAAQEALTNENAAKFIDPPKRALLETYIAGTMPPMPPP